MQRYEYRSLVVSDPAALSAPETVAELNRLGGEGWHVATAVPEQRHGYVHEVHVLLVRPQVPDPGASPAR